MSEYTLTIEEAKRYFQDSDMSTQEARSVSELCRDYYDGKQLTDDEVRELQLRGQPEVVFNRIAPKVDFVIGMEMSSRTDPKCFPRNKGVDEDAALAATDALRYIADISDMDMQTSQAVQNLVIEGACGGQVVAEQLPNGDVQIRIEYIPWDRIFWDPKSRMYDFSDAKYKGIVVWMDLADAKEMYPEAEDIIASSANLASTYGDTYSDRPLWYDATSNRPRVRICELWCRKIVDRQVRWYRSVFCSGGFIEDPAPSPFVDDNGQSACPLIFQSAKIDRYNQRYGMVKALISPQDEVNKRRSKALHLLNSRQTLSEKGAVDDLAMMKSQLARPDGHIVVNQGLRFELLGTSDLTQGQFSLLAEAKAELDSVSVNTALSGRDQHLMSGKAIHARQQGGLVELQPIFDGLKTWKTSCYRMAWYMVKKFWTEEKWFRVTDSRSASKFVGINVPVTVADVVEEKYGIPKDKIGQLPPQVLQQIGNLDAVVGTKNEVTQMDLDIILEESPDIASIQIEQFEQLVQMASQGVPIPPDIIIEASSLRNKDIILRALRGDPDSPEGQKRAQMQAMQEQYTRESMQLDLQKKAADIQLTVSKARDGVAQAEERQSRIAKHINEIRDTRLDMMLKTLGYENGEKNGQR